MLLACACSLNPIHAWAKGPSKNSLNCIFGNLYSSVLFRSGQCDGNICELLRQFVSAEGATADLRRAKILIFNRVSDSRASPRTLRAYALRDESTKSFPGSDYHVALEYDDRVYDFDFKPADEGMPEKDYLTAMFIPPPGSGETPDSVKDTTQVRSVPVVDFLTEYGRTDSAGRHVGIDYYLSPDNRFDFFRRPDRYPPRTLRQVLSEGSPEVRSTYPPETVTAAMGKPRIVIARSQEYGRSLLIWREGDRTVTLDSVSGKVSVRQGQLPVDDPKRLKRFMKAVQELAPRNDEINRLWQRYLMAGGRPDGSAY